jgi:2-polyprenyl-3-methyl-5-hydroxy-6-metoxy-1,4-benzoquinol methylase
LTGGIHRLGFLPGSEGGSALDYVRRLGRLRWKRRFRERRAVDLDGGRPASETFAAGEDWLVVCDEVAIPLPGNDELAPVEGHVVIATRRSPADPPAVHTLAELERANIPSAQVCPAHAGDPPAIGFSVSDFPPSGGETVRDYVRRLLSSAPARRFPGRFAAIVFEEVAGTDPAGVCTRLVSSAGERPEIVRHLPDRVRRLLDVGCGTGETSAAIRRASPGMSITGIERHAAYAERARARMDRVIARDATQALRDLADEGARFDAFLFADVLEHLEDPIGALTLARGLAAVPGATLVASVPNVAHLSLVRDLVVGRFDPVPAGLADVGHLRWFTRSSLEEALDEAGWRTVGVTALPGAPAPDVEPFLDFVAAFPEFDRDALATYQWVAVARAE